MKELAPNTYAFAEHELDLGRRLLVRGGQSIPLNAKAFDLLVVLIENRERVIAKDSYQGLWRQALVEEKPELVKGFEEVRVFQFTWSLDGKHLTYTTGKATREIILIENFRLVSQA